MANRDSNSLVRNGLPIKLHISATKLGTHSVTNHGLRLPLALL